VNISQDRIGNILLLELSGQNINSLIIVSVYGPNENNGEFYADLTSFLDNYNANNIVCGGDFNCTWDQSPAEINIDTLFMRNIPSIYRSNKIKTIADRFKLADPFRFLYPNRREYTYIPNAVANRNRSRIDFFMVSDKLIPCISEADIPIGKLSTLFDHKSIVMSTRKKTKSRDPNKIKDSVLDLLPVKIAVELAVKEFYLNNTDPDTVPRYVITELRLDFGRVYSRLSEASKLELLALRENNLDNNTKIRIAQLVSDAADISETLPTLEFFEGLDLLPEPDTFFEGLVLAVKNEVLSKQASIFKIKKFRRTLLTDRIRALKENAIENYAEISRQEAILNDIIESELRDELLCYSKFERLNNEKITPYFLKLAQVDTNQHGLDKICDDSGAIFPSANERESYIADFYEQLYKKPIGPERDGQCITEFLSDILDHPTVLDSKLNQDERERLDSDLTISEFDDAIKEIKTNTSPGIDGISNRFIKKFWKLFRCPLFKYATFCLNKGELTENFRSAKVRLIPKKGDPKKISNWRPISLLNCFYKIISRVLTMRLRTVSDKITCIGQKGYSSKKFSQEVLISLLDKIANAKKLNATGCILSLDIKKAFEASRTTL
jgi:hypothetical protein